MTHAVVRQPVAGVGIVGCGYVFDHYLATWARHPGLSLRGVHDIDPTRAAAVAREYDVHDFGSLEALLADPDVEIVVNLTSIDSHERVSKAALEAGKHVFSEKPVAVGLERAAALYELAESRGLLLATAPSNTLSPTIQTLWHAVRDGAVGNPRLVYAEFDDNPITLMHPERWRSRSGAPWPHLDEYAHGCTIEHGGYHLTWLSAMFGPVASVTAFSTQVIPDKPSATSGPPSAADFSVACLAFASGVVARLTFSIAAPLDHRMRIIGDQGMLTAETYRHYECPVYHERFTDLTLNARKAKTVRASPLVAALLGVRGRRVPMAPAPYGRPSAGEADNIRRPSPTRWLRELKRRETGVQDKCIGIANLADAIRTGRAPFPPPDLALHVIELLYTIHTAGTRGGAHELTTTFAPVAPATTGGPPASAYRPPLRTRALNAVLRPTLDRLHRH